MKYQQLYKPFCGSVPWFYNLLKKTFNMTLLAHLFLNKSLCEFENPLKYIIKIHQFVINNMMFVTILLIIASHDKYRILVS